MAIDSIIFLDKNSGDDACVLVRVIGDSVGLALSLKKVGDVEIFMEAAELDQVIGALQEARSAIGGERSDCATAPARR